MSLQIVVDMNLSVEWIPLLEQAGWLAIHWSAVGDPRANDTTIMAWGSGPRSCGVHTRSGFRHCVGADARRETERDSSSCAAHVAGTHRNAGVSRVEAVRTGTDRRGAGGCRAGKKSRACFAVVVLRSSFPPRKSSARRGMLPYRAELCSSSEYRLGLLAKARSFDPTGIRTGSIIIRRRCRHRRGLIILRKEVIQPQVPLRLPCYDLVPIAEFRFGACLP